MGKFPRMGLDMAAGSPSASSPLLFSSSHTNLAFPVLLGYVAQPECLPCSSTGRGSTPRRPRSFSGSLPSLAIPVGLSGRHGLGWVGWDYGPWIKDPL